MDSLCDRTGEENIAVAGFYCDFPSQQEQTINNTVGAILKQLVGRGRIMKDLRVAFQKASQELGGRGPRLVDMVGMLRTAIASIPRVFICIDALDECLPRCLPELLGSLRDIVKEAPNTRIFLTGRPHVWGDIQRYFSQTIVIPLNPNTNDIRDYVEMRLDRDSETEAMSNGLRADIVRVIQEKISDMCVGPFSMSPDQYNVYLLEIVARFLLVSLHIDAILGEVTIRQRRRKLEEMTLGDGLNDAYTATLSRLKAQKGYKSVLGLKVLMWVLYSERPLRSQELCHALGVEVGSTDLDQENVPALRTLLSSCVGLVTVEASSSTVRLVHFTLQEHLSRDPTLFQSPHSTIAEVCLTYLNFGCIRNISPTLYSAPATTPLLEYASVYWGRHGRRGMTENIKIVALKLLDRFDEHISAQLLLLHYDQHRGGGPKFDKAGGPRGFSGLHGVAFLGIVGIVSTILEMKEWDVNAYDCIGMTALTWASFRGHDEVVRALLGRGDINPDQADTKYGQTPLAWAALNGHEGVVKMLLERDDVNPDRASKYGRTPLSCAAEKGHEGVVKMLLERDDVNPDQVDIEYGQTPLSWAAENGHEGVVKMLLQRDDVNPDRASKSGRTPLSSAALKGHEGVVKILLQRDDVNPDLADTEYGRTPLSWAAENRHEGVVKILLQRDDVNPDRASKSGRTPLLRAASNGHEGVVKMLLHRDDVNPDLADTNYGRTPLSWAGENGNEGVVKMLLQRDDVNPDLADTYYCRTPLSWAAENGHVGVVKMLLQRDDVNPDRASKYGRTPLSWAASNGHEGVVKMLLHRDDVNPDLANKYGRTPLSWAASDGHEGVVKMLLERGDVNPDQVDIEYGQTPLSWAAENGHVGVVKMLLEREDVDPDRAGAFDWTPLEWAASNGHEEVVEVIRQWKDGRTAMPDNMNRNSTAVGSLRVT